VYGIVMVVVAVVVSDLIYCYVFPSLPSLTRILVNLGNRKLLSGKEMGRLGLILSLAYIDGVRLPLSTGAVILVFPEVLRLAFDVSIRRRRLDSMAFGLKSRVRTRLEYRFLICIL
jgi:hypothetical protein